MRQNRLEIGQIKKNVTFARTWIRTHDPRKGMAP